jgi:hypothetical protein
MFLGKTAPLAQLILLASFSAGMAFAQNLTITTNPVLPPAQVGIGYPPLTLTASGGTPPYTWSVIGTGLNGLPTGMQLSANGVITGTPSSNAATQPIIRVQDAALSASTQQFTLNVGTAGTLTRTAVLAQIAAGAAWDTTIYLVNTSSANINSATVTFRGDSGAAMPYALTQTQQGNTQAFTASLVTVIMNPSTTVTLHTTAPTNTALQQGWADVFTTGGIGSYAVFRQTLPSGTVALGTSAQTTQLQPSVVVPYDNTGGNTGTFGLVSLSTAPVTPLATVFDENGNQLAAPMSVFLPILGHTAAAVPTLFPVTAGKRGFVRFDNSSTDTLAGLGLNFSVQIGGAFTSVPVLAALP